MANTSFSLIDTAFKDVKIITPFYMEDARGYFLKSFERDVFKTFGLNPDLFEDFESYSSKNVIRGLHFQTKNPQIKLVRVIIGSVMDVIVDLRKDSPDFGKWTSFELNDKNHYELWIPAGFAHGFKVLSENAVMSYKCVGKYEKGFDSGIKWNDPDIGVEWNIDNPIISERDKQLMSFKRYKKTI